MSKIHILPDQLVGKIAAGEVVERPASVVKELVENALDAGAQQIQIQLETGGKSLIEVADDGSGMDADDALLAPDRHATSKIRDLEDLERIGTLGFRGEALASIAAVSTLTLTSASSHGEARRVQIQDGKVQDTEPTRRSQGTTVRVEQLLSSVPARRKFMKSDATELRHCVDVVQGYALARPDVRFLLKHGIRTLLRADPAGVGIAGARERVRQSFGDDLAELLTPFDASGAGGESVWGLVGDRSTTRGRRIFVYVNSRLLRDRALLATFYRAVRETWHQDEFPALFLFLDLDPREVDVNVHPQKSEVRFRHYGVVNRVGAVLREALAEARGEEEAPLAATEGNPGESSAWRWAGSGSEMGSVREPGVLAEPLYRPLERAPARLSGHRATHEMLRLIGQYKGTLILLEAPEALLLVDQHVAHERILYERLRRDLESEEVPSQRLIEPKLLATGRSERLRLQELLPELAACGFELVELSGESLGVVATPASLSAEQAERTLLELSTAEDEEEPRLRERLLNALAASTACKAAVKMHDPLTPESMEQLVQELFAAEQPFACPHGRPIVLRMEDADLERRLQRR